MSSEGLAHQMVYGDGSSQTVRHHYAGTLKKHKRKATKKTPCRKRKK